MDTPPVVHSVPVVSAWESKINWTQAIAALATVFTLFGINLDAQTQASILGIIAGGSAVTTWVLRTWFTTSLTATSVQK